MNMTTGAASPELDTDDKLRLLARTGALMLENGSATYRVDETLDILGSALGLSEVEVFATPTGLVIGAKGPQGSVARVLRLASLGVNMNRLAEVNHLSHEASGGALSPEQIAERMAQIERQGSQYPTWLVVGGVAAACGAFALLFGGGWREFLAAALGAGLAMAARIALGRIRLVPLIVTVIVAFVATAASTLLCHPFACIRAEIVPVAAVLQLAPGVPLVTWVIDLATGDILSGVSRAAYAALIAMGIALGMLLFLVWGLL
jgi:uncharacterized membrane protein YjjP (DUF1212 family)